MLRACLIAASILLAAAAFFVEAKAVALCQHIPVSA